VLLIVLIAWFNWLLSVKPWSDLLEVLLWKGATGPIQFLLFLLYLLFCSPSSEAGLLKTMFLRFEFLIRMVLAALLQIRMSIRQLLLTTLHLVLFVDSVPIDLVMYSVEGFCNEVVLIVVFWSQYAFGISSTASDASLLFIERIHLVAYASHREDISVRIVFYSNTGKQSPCWSGAHWSGIGRVFGVMIYRVCVDFQIFVICRSCSGLRQIWLLRRSSTHSAWRFSYSFFLFLRTHQPW